MTEQFALGLGVGVAIIILPLTLIVIGMNIASEFNTSEFLETGGR